MGWLAYYLKDYERGVFYMDAALSEDVANNPHWQGTPAAAFLFLDPSHPDAAAKRIVNQMRAQVDAQVAKFAGVAGVSYTTYDLVDKFVRPKANDPTHRSIVTALLTFILEGKDRVRQLGLRSAHGGTLEPFLSHLFKGGLVFESLLKLHYQALSTAQSMGGYLATSAARSDLGLSASPLYAQLPRPTCSFNDVLTILPAWRGQPVGERSVGIAYGTRNTSGHDLAWPATLDQNTYQELYEGVLTAILLLVKQRY